MGTETGSQVKRKQTLEAALERRFVVAKAELLQQQKKSQKHISNEEDRKESNTNTIPSSFAPPANLPAGPVTASSNSSSKRDMEQNGPAYSQLSHPVHENLLTTNVKFQSKKGSMVDMILHDLLQHGDSAQKYMQGSRSKKLDNWILLDNYVQGRGKSTSSHIKALQAHSRRSRRRMSMKQHKKYGSFDLPQDLQKYDSFKPMHEIWKGYIVQLLKKYWLAHCLLGADLHGAIILVAECKIASFTGVSGIMIRETAETFGIITQDDKLRLCQKDFPSLCSKLIAGRSHYKGTSSPQEMWVYDHHQISY